MLLNSKVGIKDTIHRIGILDYGSSDECIDSTKCIFFDCVHNDLSK